MWQGKQSCDLARRSRHLDSGILFCTWGGCVRRAGLRGPPPRAPASSVLHTIILCSSNAQHGQRSVQHNGRKKVHVGGLAEFGNRGSPARYKKRRCATQYKTTSAVSTAATNATRVTVLCGVRQQIQPIVLAAKVVVVVSWPHQVRRPRVPNRSLSPFSARGPHPATYCTALCCASPTLYRSPGQQEVKEHCKLKASRSRLCRDGYPGPLW